MSYIGNITTEGGLCKEQRPNLVCDQICQPSNEDEDEMKIDSRYRTDPNSSAMTAYRVDTVTCNPTGGVMATVDDLTCTALEARTKRRGK